MSKLINKSLQEQLIRSHLIRNNLTTNQDTDEDEEIDNKEIEKRDKKLISNIYQKILTFVFNLYETKKDISGTIIIVPESFIPKDKYDEPGYIEFLKNEIVKKLIAVGFTNFKGPLDTSRNGSLDTLCISCERIDELARIFSDDKQLKRIKSAKKAAVKKKKKEYLKEIEEEKAAVKEKKKEYLKQIDEFKRAVAMTYKDIIDSIIWEYYYGTRDEDFVAINLSHVLYEDSNFENINESEEDYILSTLSIMLLNDGFEMDPENSFVYTITFKNIKKLIEKNSKKKKKKKK